MYPYYSHFNGVSLREIHKKNIKKEECEVALDKRDRYIKYLKYIGGFFALFLTLFIFSSTQDWNSNFNKVIRYISIVIVIVLMFTLSVLSRLKFFNVQIVEICENNKKREDILV